VRVRPVADSPAPACAPQVVKADLAQSDSAPGGSPVEAGSLDVQRVADSPVVLRADAHSAGEAGIPVDWDLRADDSRVEPVADSPVVVGSLTADSERSRGGDLQVASARVPPVQVVPVVWAAADSLSERSQQGGLWPVSRVCREGRSSPQAVELRPDACSPTVPLRSAALGAALVAAGAVKKKAGAAAEPFSRLPVC